VPLDTTIPVEPGWRFALDAYENGILELVGASGEREQLAAAVGAGEPG
jgi:hypothetical protein